MKLSFVLAAILVIGNGPAQESGKEVLKPLRENPFVGPEHFLEGSKVPLSLYSHDLELWELVNKVTSEPPKYPPGTGIGIGSPVGQLQVVKAPGQGEPSFRIGIYPRLAKDETGLMGISRVTVLEEHVKEERYLGWFDHKELRELCEAEGMRELAEQAKAKPLHAFSMIGLKEGSSGVWVEKLYLFNVSDQPLPIGKLFFRVRKAGTTDELRKVEGAWPLKAKGVHGEKLSELLPQRSCLALTTEWDAIPDLAAQSCSVAVRVGGERGGSSVVHAEVIRSIDAKMDLR